ncbi:hypothetical protein SLS56_004575 [Neofusicoccum ribis]|uniref:Rta1 domain protein n=1 Tax=Neofusicoccum ribis TaxID=45134 RepID=A0ABR3SWM8_9PEZI
MNLHGFKLYHYQPSVAAAVIFALLFLVTSILHLLQMIKAKTWYLIAQPYGEWKVMPYSIQSTYILIAPALFAASVYMILGRIVLLTDGEKYSIISRWWLTKTFVFGDIVCFIFQGGGGSLLAIGGRGGNSTMVNAGNNLIIAGLVIQVLFFSLFIVTASLFHRRMAQFPTTKSLQPEIRWRQYLFTLYLVSVLILIRSLFRVVEYCQGTDGYLLSKEVFMYLFDSLLMLAVMVYMNWKHPSEIGLLLRGEAPSDKNFILFSVGPNKSTF